MKIARLIWSFFWTLLTLWMLTYSMYVSFVYSLAMLWCFIPSEKKKGWKAWFILGFSPIVIWNVGLMEYGLKTIDLHCRVNGYFGKEKPAFCAYQPEAYKTDSTTGRSISTMEHLGVHGFNVMLATGGAVVGLLKWRETLYEFC